MDGVFTSPYTGNVNGGPNIPAICDDFLDDVNPPEYWKALATNLANLGTSTTDDVLLVDARSVGATQQQAYMVVAYLAEEILGTTDETLRGELSFALWEVFDPAAASGLTSVQQNGGGGYEGAGKYLLDAQKAVQANVNTQGLSQYLSTFSNITIYSATTNGTTAEAAGTAGPPQEFIVVNMPEPELIAMLGLDLLGMSALVLFLRRRSARTALPPAQS